MVYERNYFKAAYFEAVKVLLKQEALTKAEIHDLTDYILDNSILELSAEKSVWQRVIILELRV